MSTIVLILGIALLVVAMYSHALAQANVIKKIDNQWFERLFISRRASTDNLNDEGKQYRKQSNLCALGGFLLIALYVFLRYSA